jgi:hypothetical protein
MYDTLSPDARFSAAPTVPHLCHHHISPFYTQTEAERLFACLLRTLVSSRTTKTMKFLHHAVGVLLLSCVLPPSSVTALEGVLLGQLEMEMGSRSNTDPNSFLVQVIAQTQEFLDNAFGTIYNGTDYDFSHTSLSVTSYSIDGDGDSSTGEGSGTGYIARMDLAGTIFFGDAPPQVQVSTVISAAFQQQNQRFLQSLVLSNDPFLQDINYAIVRVVQPRGAGGRSNTAAADPNVNAEESSGMDSWMLALIVGAGTFVVVFCVCLLCVCFTPLSELQPDSIEYAGSGKQPPISTKDTSDVSLDVSDDEENDPYEKTRRASHHDPERPTSRQPRSPDLSVTSQDSSRFTYNPKSARSSTTGGSFLNGPAEALDIEAWEQGSTIIDRSGMNMPPFGHDISAIENKKDLSLIEEGDFEDVTPHKDGGGGGETKDVHALRKKRLQGQYLSRQAVYEIDRHRGGRGTGTGAPSQPRPVSSNSNRGSNNHNHSNGASTVSTSRPPRVSTNTNTTSSSTNDVIADLNDLSLQFNRYRGGGN